MNIGVDLDNTLVDYDAAFLAAAESLQIGLESDVQSKSQVREFLRSQPEGEQRWQRLQGLAYGRFLKSHARLYPGVHRFLWRCREQGHTVRVISHKTEYGHFDAERVPLRKVALEILEAQGVVDTHDAPVREVLFHTTLEEKFACIEKHSLD